MIPVRDINPTSTTPYVNYLLIAVNVLGFLVQLLLDAGGALGVTEAYGVVPTRIALDPAGELFTVFTAMFMHGGFVHLGGNMLFLHIFGDNVEDAVGHGRYLAFYLLAGLAAASAQVGVDPSSPIPMVGASGAIGGVLAAYVLLYPKAPVLVLNPVPLLWLVWGLFITLPAWFFVAYWFVWEQLLSGVIAPRTDGVAFYAHIGGFLGGLLLIRPMMTGRERRPTRRWDGWRPPPPPPGGFGPGPPSGRRRPRGISPKGWDRFN